MRTFSVFSMLALIATIIITSGCKETPKTETRQVDSTSVTTIQRTSLDKTVNANDTAKIYRVLATVTEVSEADSTITIDHGKMEGFMEAMEMAYKVADQSIFKEVRVGTKGHFTLKVVDGEGIITSVHVHNK